MRRTVISSINPSSINQSINQSIIHSIVMMVSMLRITMTTKMTMILMILKKKLNHIPSHHIQPSHHHLLTYPLQSSSHHHHHLPTYPLQSTITSSPTLFNQRCLLRVSLHDLVPLMQRPEQLLRLRHVTDHTSICLLSLGNLTDR